MNDEPIEPADEPETLVAESYRYGRLWPDGTFQHQGSYERYARKEFDDKSYELKYVPESLRPVFGRQRVVTTTETYRAEPVPEADR